MTSSDNKRTNEIILIPTDKPAKLPEVPGGTDLIKHKKGALTVKPVIAAVDVGNAYTKMAFWKDGQIQTAKFKSRVREGVPGIAMVGASEERPPVFRLSGQKLTVEDNAINPKNIIKEGPDSIAVKALTLASLVKNGFAGQSVLLATNLPLGQHVVKDENGQLVLNEALIKSKTATLKDGSDDDACLTGFALPTIEKVMVQAEGYAAYIDSVVSETGVITEPAEGKLRGFLDIGGGTTEIGLVGKNFSLQDSFITLNTGTIEVARRLEESLLSRWPDYTKIDPSQLDLAIETGKFTYLDGTVHDISADVDRCKAIVARQIVQEAKERLKSNVDILDKILLVGGGGQLLKDHFEWNLVDAPKDPDFANARGLLKILTFHAGLQPDEFNREVQPAVQEPVAQVQPEPAPAVETVAAPAVAVEPAVTQEV